MPAVSAPAKPCHWCQWIYWRVGSFASFLRKATQSADRANPKKGEHLKSLFRTYGQKFELSVVDDITKVIQLLSNFKLFRLIPLQEGAFDEAVGVSTLYSTLPRHSTIMLGARWYIFLCAHRGPYSGASSEIIVPALKGTLSILESVKRYGFVISLPIPAPFLTVLMLVLL